MLLQDNMPKVVWAKIVHTTFHNGNQSLASSIVLKTQNEVWSGKLSNYSYLRVFGFPFYYYVNERKVEPRSKKAKFLKYVDGVKEYKL